MNGQFSETLKGLKLKATPKRLAILRLLALESTYVSPEEIWLKLRGRFGAIGLPTVYRNLEELAAGGVITKVIHPNRQLYYYLCSNRHHHHHFICVACRRVEDVDVCVLDDLEREIDTKIGGRVLSHIVQVNGLCRCCVGAAEGSGGKEQ
jgi:Fe2+ or Zn2+ uptake regulation protein